MIVLGKVYMVEGQCRHCFHWSSMMKYILCVYCILLILHSRRCYLLFELFFFWTRFGWIIRVIQKVTAKTPVCILEEESEHQTVLCTKTRRKKNFGLENEATNE